MPIQAWKQVGDEVRIDQDFMNKNWAFLSQFFGEAAEPLRLFGKALIFRSFQRPDGTVVEHFAMLKENPAAKKLALTKDSRVIAVRQYKQGCGICIELPGGASDRPGETPEQIAERELLEETGYKAGRITRLGPAQYMSSRNSVEATTQLMLALECEKIAEGKLETSGEEIEVLLIPFQEWIRMCQGALVDPFSIVATFLALPYLETK